MPTSNNQPQDLYAINTVQDLSQESAATIQGGALEVFEHADFGGDTRLFDYSQSSLTHYLHGAPIYSFDDKISSVGNYTDSYWALYPHANYGGTPIIIKPWQEMTWIGTQFNDKISSIKRL